MSVYVFFLRQGFSLVKKNFQKKRGRIEVCGIMEQWEHLPLAKFSSKALLFSASIKCNSLLIDLILQRQLRKEKYCGVSDIIKTSLWGKRAQKSIHVWRVWKKEINNNCLKFGLASLSSMSAFFNQRQYCLLGNLWPCLETVWVVTQEGYYCYLEDRGQGCC